MIRLLTWLLLLVCLSHAEPQRIISTAPSITELLFALGLGPHVVGVSVYCKYPPQVRSLPKVGTFLKPDVETIAGLRPDLVVVHRQPNDISPQLDKLHIRHVEVDSENLDAVYQAARTVAAATRIEPEAERWITSMQDRLHRIQVHSAGRPAITAVFLAGHTAGRLEGLIAGSSSSYLSDLLSIAGGRNVFVSPVGYIKVSLEEILVRNPDVILELSGEDMSKQQDVLSSWQNERSLKAVREGHVYAVPSDAVLVPGPRAAEGAEFLEHLLHPESHP